MTASPMSVPLGQAQELEASECHSLRILADRDNGTFGACPSTRRPDSHASDDGREDDDDQ